MIDESTVVRREITVAADPAKAFRVFTEGMTGWWPAHHHIGSTPIAEIVIEPHEGGRWFTRHEDGSETSTGYVETWDPPQRLVLVWQISAEWSYEPSLVTRVVLGFTPDGDGTRVSLVHELQNYGPAAEKMRDVFDSPGAWDGTLAAYAQALS